MKSTTLFAFAAAAPMILADAAPAAFTGIKGVYKPNPYALTFNIYATFDARPGDFIFAVAGTPLNPLNVNVRGGTFYQNQFGTDQAPNLNHGPVLPSLAFDTFVTIGRKTGPQPIPDGTTLAPDWPGFRPDRLTMDGSGWYITPTDINGNPTPQGIPNANGQVLLMQLSTQNGTGFYGTIMVNGFNSPGGLENAFQEVVEFNVQIPAPGAAALLGGACLLGSRRRRRCSGGGLLTCPGSSRRGPREPRAP